MALFDPKNTLAYHSARPLTIARDMSFVSCKSVADACKTALPDQLVLADTCALTFYALNHGKAIIQQKYLPLEPMAEADNEFVSAYYAAASEEAVRTFYYLLLICVRESRHVYKFGSSTQDMIIKKFGADCLNLTGMIHNCGSEDAYTKFLVYPPKTSIGNLCDYLRFVFYKGNFGSSFGGEPWGRIADCLARFVKGEYTPEMMVDTSFTLAHNNGPMHNKEMFFSGYTAAFIRILDVQRSGQIPEMILSCDSEIIKLVPVKLLALLRDLNKRHACFGFFMDWFKVEALGSVGKYPYEKTLQSKMHGLTTEQLKQIQVAKTAQEKKVALAAMAEAEKLKAFFEVFPDQWLPIITPKSRLAS